MFKLNCILVLLILLPACGEQKHSTQSSDEKPPKLLLDAIVAGDVLKVKAMLANGADVNAVTEGGITSLMYAAEQGNTEIAQILIARGAQVNANYFSH